MPVDLFRSLFGRRLDSLGVAASRHAADRARHVEALVIEPLVGSIDNTNRVFRSSHVPRYDTAVTPLLVIRGLVYAASSGWFTQAGRTWWLTDAPIAGGGFTDPAPIAIYLWNPAAAEPDFDPATMLDSAEGRPFRRPTMRAPREEWVP